MKKVMPIFLALALCAGLLSGCQSSELKAYSDDDSTSDTDAELDYTPCFECYDPDEVMMTINGIDVTWRDLFYWYYYDVSSIAQYYGNITDWDEATAFDDSQTYREYVTDNALETVKHYYALESKAEDMGIELTDEETAAIQSSWDDNVDTYSDGDEEAFEEYLESAFLTKDMFFKINEISSLYTHMENEMYGEDGDKLSDDEVIEKAEDLGYMRAKHIFMSTTDDSGNDLTDEEKAEKKAQLQTLLDELSAITDPDELEAKMDELAAEYSEDTGLDYYPDGYTFTSLEDTFDAAVANTEVNSLYPEIVESSMGYHIILRLPLSTTAIVEYTSSDECSYLPSIVADSMFESDADSWADESEVVYTKAYKKMDIAKVFAKAVEVVESDDTGTDTETDSGTDSETDTGTDSETDSGTDSSSSTDQS